MRREPMKYYSTKIINDFIQKNHEKIRCIYVGMHEDWEPTAVMIYKDGEVLKKTATNGGLTICASEV